MSTKFVLGLLTGVAVGAAAVYIATHENKDEIIDDLKDVAKKAKRTLNDQLARFEKQPSETMEEYGIGA